MRITTDPEEAARSLAEGGVVAIPTETVYGLGALADSPDAVAGVYAAKGRPADHPLIVHVASADAVGSWTAHMPDYALRLGGAYWPGPLTLVLPRSARARDFITGTQDTVAVRVPGNALTREVIRRVGEILGDPHVGIAAPSANRFGRVSPTRAQDVVTELAEHVSPGTVIAIHSTIADTTVDTNAPPDTTDTFDTTDTTPPDTVIADTMIAFDRMPAYSANRSFAPTSRNRSPHVVRYRRNHTIPVVKIAMTIPRSNRVPGTMAGKTAVSGKSGELSCPVPGGARCARTV